MQKLAKIFCLSFVLLFSFSYSAFADTVPTPVCKIDRNIVAPNDQVVFTPSMPSSTDRLITYRWVGEASTTSTGAIAMAFIYPGNYTIALYATPSNGATYSIKCPPVTVSLDATPSTITGGFYPYPFASSTLKAQIPNEQNPVPASCLNLVQNLSFGYYDDTKVKSDGVIYKLQVFLKNNGYLKANPSGYFGPMTRVAVKAFQAEKGIEATGFVGPLTRASIKSLSCSLINNNESFL